MSSKSRSGGGCAATLFNILTILTLLGVVLVVLTFIAWFTSPALVPQPLRPPVIPTVPPTNTPSPTPIKLPPTFTPQPTNTPRPTNTLRPTSTPIPTDTPFSLVTPPTSEASPTPEFAYAVQSNNPIYIENIFHPELGCDWMGVAGQALDLNDAPITGLVVELGGQLGGQSVSMISLTGAATIYGPSGYEFVLADSPTASTGSLYVQLLDQAGRPISEKFFFDTSASCEENLIIINFEKLR